jgi:HAD superfamily hydrolase (TIGR01459 family)
MQDHSTKSSITLPGTPDVEPLRLASGLQEFAADYDLLLCDVWGVLHNGVAYYEKAINALKCFRDAGGSVVLLTNAPRPQSKVARMLDGLGVPAQAYDGIVTSGDVTARMILARNGEPVGHIGPDYDAAIFSEAERLSGRPVARVEVEEASYVVCTGLFDAERESPADYEARFVALKQRGLDFICANPDIVVEVGETLYYCAGVLAELYEKMGGTVIQAGKPHSPIYDRALALATEIRGKAIDRRRVLAIGDGLNTDIRGAANQAIEALFITSGIHRADLHDATGEIDMAVLQRFILASGLRPPKATLAELAW